MRNIKKYSTLIKVLLILVILLSVNLLEAKVIKKDTKKEYWNTIIKELSIEERNTLVKIFVKGIPYDLSYTLTAIAIKESTVGRYMFNINDKKSVDVGIFMINSKEYLRRNNLEDNTWNTARAMEVLQDFDLNFSEAILTFNSCLKKAKGDKKKAWGYYNQWNNGGNKEYSKDISAIIQVLKEYFRVEMYNKHRKELKD